MWRSKARALLILRSQHTRSTFQRKLPLKTLALIPTSPPLSSRWTPNPRFFSTEGAANPSLAGSVSDPNEVGIDENDDFATSRPWNFEEPEESSPLSFDDEIADSSEISPPFDFEESDASPIKFDDETDKGGIFGELVEESGGSSLVDGEGEGEGDGVEVKVSEIDVEQVEAVVSILKGSSSDPIELSLDKLELSLSEDFVVKVIEAADDLVGENLIGFFKWAIENNESVKTSTTIDLLIVSVYNHAELNKKEAYMLWDLIKELGKEKWVLNTKILNELILMFCRLDKGKAGFEVFSKFDEFGCNPDADTYYYTIKALGRRSMFDTAWSVCEKMLNSGNLPDNEKIGEIITFFCKGKKVKEAHLVYLMAKEKNLIPQRSSLDFLICGLTRNDETVPLALELLADYPKGTYKHANKAFSSVVKGLCRIKNPQEAKKLLLKMVESGPPPGNATFNYVITALSKGGEMEDAVALLKVMEGRGLRPDVYTYTVVMSGYAKGGLMDEAYNIFCEAKKRHDKFSPATYHVLTRGYCKMEEFGKALECMQEMKDHGVKPNADEYNKLIESLCLKALDWRSAEKLLEEMKESGLYLKGVTRSLISAVKELEEEEIPPEVTSITA